MPPLTKNIALWVGIMVAILLLVNLSQGGLGSDTASSTGGATRLAYSEFLSKVESGEVRDVIVRESAEAGTLIQGHLTNGERFALQGLNDPRLVEILRANNVKLSAAPGGSGADSLLSIFLSSWLPFLVLIGVYVFFMRQMQGKSGGGGGAMGFGKSRAKMLNENTEKKTFDDVAGIDEAKEELQELVDFLKNPQKFQKLGGRIPKGCLLVGPPGTGKTLLARAIAGEAGVPFFSISGSDFVEMFVGVGASRVRDMFEQGKKNAPCIIFIDEIDAVGRHRGAGIGGGNDEREQTLNQLLVEMDGFEANEGVILIAATNRPDVLDSALLRPGRFDRQIVVPNPDIEGRTKILNVHLKKVPMAPDVDAKILARGTPGFSGADLANLVNEAALLAARQDKKVVTMRELEAAKDKVMMGVERKSMVMSEEEKRMTAYHEAGHAVVSIHFPASDPIHKATIIPRGRALGMVMRLPEADKISYLRDKMLADLAVSMGGRAAEEIIFGHAKVSSGASSDIQYATRLANAMVTQWGMSDTLGPILFAATEEHQAPMIRSPEAIAQVDAEIKRIVNDAHKAASAILTDHRDQLEAVALALIEYETLTGDEIKQIMAGERITRPDPHAAAPKAVRSKLPGARKADGTGESDSVH
ncbi:MAG: ATP-dependent zinc metalloprotease FtsH [Alphaproteobacteria bacterium]|nr:ATP-dependent zinc metalloprotease FtsH [Alphaproteobacteria bacterium]